MRQRLIMKMRKEVNWHSLTGGGGEGLEKYVKNEQDRRFRGLGGGD